MWVGVRGNPGLLLRIDPKNRAQPAKTIELPDGLQNIAVGGGAVWIIARRAQHGHAPGHRQRHPAPDLRRREAVRDRLRARRGVGDQQRRRHRHADRQRVAEHATITESGDGPKGIAVGAGAVWVANSIASTVTRIDPQANRPSGDPIAVALNPYGVDTHGNDVWITSPSDGKVQRLTPSG